MAGLTNNIKVEEDRPLRESHNKSVTVFFCNIQGEEETVTCS